MLSEDLRLFSKCINDFVRPFYSNSADRINVDHWHMLRDSLSEGQLQSKLHLLDCMRSQFKTPFKKAAFIGHWHGLFPLMFYEFGLIESAIGVELSEKWSSWSHQLNGHWSWQSIVADAAEFDFTGCDLIVNTSCEHMSYNWLSRVPAGCVLALQSTDYQIPEHVNCVQSLGQFKEKVLEYYKNSSVELTTTSENQHEIYKRFTVILRAGKNEK